MSWRIKKILITHALIGFICWYSIEKVFQRSIGISVFEIALMAVVYIATSAILNIPTGLLADKYGRKYAIFLATVALLACTIVAGTAHSFAQYTFAVFLWGVFFTTQNGAYEAILYDSLKEEGNVDKYTKYSGFSSAGFWLAIFVSSIIGAYVGSQFGLRYAYLITVIPNVLAVLLALTLQEPKNHALKATVSSVKMVRAGFKAVTSSSRMIYLSATYLVVALAGWSANEFSQLFFIELGFSVLIIGILNGVSGLFQAMGNFFSYKMSNVSNRTVVITLFVLFSLTFALPPHLRILSTCLFLVLVFMQHSFTISNNARIQHLLPSEIRATSISALGMMNDVVLVFSYLSFGYLSQRSSVRVGFLVFVVYGFVVLLIAKFFADRSANVETPIDSADGPIIDEVESYPR